MQGDARGLHAQLLHEAVRVLRGRGEVDDLHGAPAARRVRRRWSAPPGP
ncbi:hypothetical protein [Ornithinimicrobium kibberense]